MSTRVFYHTGTGNSLLVARSLAESLGAGPPLPLRALASLPLTGLEALGLVFPVNFLGLPRYVRDLLRGAALHEGLYVFAAATNGGDPGNALGEVDRILREKGLRLDYGTSLPMGDNSLATATTSAKLRERLGDIDRRVDGLARAVVSRAASPGPYGTRARTRIAGWAMEAGFELYFRPRKGRVDPEACVGCGLCARICPTGNIALDGGEPRWGDRCALCFGCLNWCPREAVSLGRLAPGPGRRQYRCPGVEAAELADEGMRAGLEAQAREGAGR
jgi:hypothetical protein